MIIFILTNEIHYKHLVITLVLKNIFFLKFGVFSYQKERPDQINVTN